MKKKLKGTDIKVCTVIGFPLGANIAEVKEYEAVKCLENGADELDMVMNIGAFLSGKYDFIQYEINRIVKVCRDMILKVIIEVGMLDDEQVICASNIVKKSGANFVKTMTGYATVGNKATIPEQIALIRKTVGKDFGIKASGGTSILENVRSFINAGANRIGIRMQDAWRIKQEW
jgi:deoxyribose-phosphate aldolase